MGIKTRRDYFWKTAHGLERVRVTGRSNLRGYVRIRLPGERVSSLLTHESHLVPIGEGA